MEAYRSLPAQYSPGVATISLRVPESQLVEIDERADAAGMTRTEFMLRAELGAATSDEQRLERIEARLDRAESVMFDS